MHELEKLDIIRERMKVSYAVAKDALDRAEGDLTEALIYLEDEGSWFHSFQAQGSGVVESVRGAIYKSGQQKVVIKDEDRVVAQFPASLGLLGLAGSLLNGKMAVIGAIGVASTLARGYSVELDNAEDSYDRQ